MRASLNYIPYIITIILVVTLGGWRGLLTHIVIVPACTIALDRCVSPASPTSGIAVPLGGFCSLQSKTLHQAKVKPKFWH